MPIVTVIDLPLPPSANRIWKRTATGMARSKAYRNWLKHADTLVMAMGSYRGAKTIHGKFDAQIDLKSDLQGDPDNQVKAILDWAQSRMLITNDKNLRDMYLRSGRKDTAPCGVRLTLTEVIEECTMTPASSS